MKNFWRTIRLCFRNRISILLVLLCSVAIGILWGTNIGAVFPFVETVFRGQTLQEWAANEIDGAQKKTDALHAELAKLRSEPEANVNQQTSLELQLQAETTALELYQRVQPFIEKYLPTTPFSTLVAVLGFVFVGTLIKGLFLAASTILTEHLAQTGTLRLRSQLFEKTLNMDLQDIERTGRKELLSRFTYDLEQITIGLRMLFGRSLREPLKIVCCLIGTAFVCWRLLILSLILAPLAAILVGTLNKALRRANRRALDEMSNIYNALSESLRSIKVVKAFVGEEQEKQKMTDAGQKFRHRAMRVAGFDALVRPTVEMMGIATICIAVLGGAYLVLNEQTHIFGIQIANRPLSISSMMLFFGLLAGTSDPARKLSGVIGKLQRAAAAADRVYELYDTPIAVQNATQTKTLKNHSAKITFNDVSFSYEEDQKTIDHVSLQIEHGETVAIVGPNGCGKTTLANLLLRFYDPQSGSVSIDGTNIRDVKIEDLRKQIGLVTQDTLLFNDTVAANIRYGRPTASQEEIESAAKRANAHEFITTRLPAGYDTIVGEGGSRLSGGQRQRVSLARAFCSDPSILILDEATSQIDLNSEAEIHRILRDYIVDRTTIIVTHRTAILELADRIVLMDHGRITKTGSYRELTDECRAFQNLVSDHSQRAA